MTSTPNAPGPRGRGRPRVGDTRVTVTVPAALVAAVDQLAADAELTRAEVIRGLLASALNIGTGLRSPR